MTPRLPAPTATARLFCTFRLAGRLFGIDLRDVKEVATETTFTRVPHAPVAVKGYVNLRGQIHLVLDLRRLLTLPPGEVTPESRLVLFKPSVGDAVGVLVDAIGDVVTIGPEQFEEWPAGMQAEQLAGELIGGVAKLDGELMLVVRARKLLEAMK